MEYLLYHAILFGSDSKNIPRKSCYCNQGYPSKSHFKLIIVHVDSFLWDTHGRNISNFRLEIYGTDKNMQQMRDLKAVQFDIN